MLSAEITPSHHTKLQTFLKNHILKRHWITSFALVEHDESVRLICGGVQSRKIGGYDPVWAIQPSSSLLEKQTFGFACRHLGYKGVLA